MIQHQIQEFKQVLPLENTEGIKLTQDLGDSFLGQFPPPEISLEVREDRGYVSFTPLSLLLSCADGD